jgi:UrcA family protein
MKTLATLASAAFISLAGPNLAHAVDDASQSITVQFADLDLDKPQGAAALFARIKNAARTVCRGYEGAAPAQKMRYKACVQFALSNAVARVDQPQLSDYFASHTAPATRTPDRLASKR